MFARRLALTVVTFLSLSSATGCESCNPPPAEGEGEGEGEGDGSISDEARELCSIFVRGQTVFTIQIINGLGSPARCGAADIQVINPDDFAADATAACQDDTLEALRDFQTALDGGRVTFDLDKVHACSALDATAQEGALPADCAAGGMFTPKQNLGDPCVQDWDCIGDNVHCEADVLTVDQKTCLAPAQEGEACLGNTDGGLIPTTLALRTCDTNLTCTNFACVAVPGLNQGCTTDTGCQDGLRCNTAVTPNVCAPLASAGQACTDDSDCADAAPTCLLSGVCGTTKEDGATCDPAVDICAKQCSVCAPTTAGGTANTCHDRGKLGAACAVNEDCQHNFVCNDTTHACVAGGGANATCAEDADCLEGFVCGGANADTCLAQPDIGDACGDTTTTSCKTGSCANGHCVAGAAGDDCETDDNCNDGLLCDAASQKCATAPTSGACSIDGACGDGFACDDDTTCKAIPGSGQACLSQNQICADGLFCDGTNCQPKKDAGSACADDSECKGLCVNEVCSTESVSCTSSKGFFPLFVILSVVLPVSRRLSRRVAEARKRR